jgi:hypothetical protein
MKRQALRKQQVTARQFFIRHSRGYGGIISGQPGMFNTRLRKLVTRFQLIDAFRRRHGDGVVVVRVSIPNNL